MRPAARPERYGWILAPLLALLAVVPVAAWRTGDPIAVFTRDIFSTARLPVYTGILSNAGILLWGATLAICLFAWAAASPTTPAETRRFLLTSAAFTAILLVDDFFMLHEWIIPRFLGFPEEAVKTTYVLLALLYAAAFRRTILRVGPKAFLAAMALFAAVIVLDFLEPAEAGGAYRLAEEVFMLLGIGTWLGFFVGVGAVAVAGERDGQRSAQATAASKSASPSGVSSRNVSS